VIGAASFGGESRGEPGMRWSAGDSLGYRLCSSRRWLVDSGFNVQRLGLVGTVHCTHHGFAFGAYQRGERRIRLV